MADRCTDTDPHGPHRAQYGPWGVKDCPGVDHGQRLAAGAEPPPPATSRPTPPAAAHTSLADGCCSPYGPADATLEVGAIPASPTAEQQIRIEALRTADNRLPVVVGGLVNDDTDAVLNLADQYAHWITHGPVVDDDPSPAGLYQWHGEQVNPDE